MTTVSFQVGLEIGGDGGAGSVGQVNHVLPVGLGGGLFGVQDWLHLGHVGMVLVLGGLVGGETLASLPDTSDQGAPPGGLDER